MPGRKTLITVAILVVLFLVRFWNPGADPPSDLSHSSSVYTDPAQYTLFAKQFVQTGDFNPYDDTRFVFFLKSSMTALAVIIFKLLGVGMWQSNLVGLLYSFGTVFLFFLFIRKIGGEIAGFLFLALIGFNYNQIFFGRLPFLEHAMSFWASLGAVLLIYFNNKWIVLGAGVSLGIGVFFGKIVGLVFLFPFACLLAYGAMYESEGSIRTRIIRPAIFTGGLLLVSLFWLYFSYLPMQTQVTSYIGEQAVDLYGSPDALQSAGDFIWSVVWFGVISKFFVRMPVVSVVGLILIIMTCYHICCGHSWRKGFGSMGSGHIFLVAMIVAFYGSLMIWNYRPLRYQLVMIYPLCGAAAIVLSMLWRKWSVPKTGRTPLLFYLFTFPIVFVASSKILLKYFGSNKAEASYNEYGYLIAVLAAIVTVWIGLAISMYRQGRLPQIPLVGKIVVILILLFVVGKEGYSYADWSQRATYNMRDNSRDLGMTLSGEAVLSGPYAAALTLENDLGAVIHMFGVSAVNKTIFDVFPVTHLLLDEANERLARVDHPRMMVNMPLICTYHIGHNKVFLYRIAGNSTNQTAGGYPLSDLEKAVDLYSRGYNSDGDKFALQYSQRNPDNLTGNLLIADHAEKAERYQGAEIIYKKAIAFSPTNHRTISGLADFYKKRYNTNGEVRLRTLGLEAYREAMRLAPDSKIIIKSYNELLSGNKSDTLSPKSDDS